MGHYQLLFHDPFVNYKLYAEYISDCFGIKYLDIGHLFGDLVFVKKPEVNKQIENGILSYFSVFKDIVISNLDGNNLIIPAYPRFLDNKAEYELLISTLTSNHFNLSSIWYVKNINLEKTISESLKTKGYNETNNLMFSSAFENAKRNQLLTNELVNSIEYNSKFIVSSDTMIEISQTTKQYIKDLVGQ